MSNVSQLSMAAYFAKVKPNLTNRQQAVLDVIKRRGSACTYTAAEELGGTSNQYSGRFTELKAKGLIEPVERRIIPTGSTAQFYRATRDNEYADLS